MVEAGRKQKTVVKDRVMRIVPPPRLSCGIVREKRGPPEKKKNRERVTSS